MLPLLPVLEKFKLEPVVQRASRMNKINLKTFQLDLKSEMKGSILGTSKTTSNTFHSQKSRSKNLKTSQILKRRSSLTNPIEKHEINQAINRINEFIKLSLKQKSNLS